MASLTDEAPEEMNRASVWGIQPIASGGILDLKTPPPRRERQGENHVSLAPILGLLSLNNCDHIWTQH